MQTEKHELPRPVVYVPRPDLHAEPDWLGFVERVLASRSKTANAAILLAVLLSGLAVVVAALGAVGTALVTMLTRRFWRGR